MAAVKRTSRGSAQNMDILNHQDLAALTLPYAVLAGGRTMLSDSEVKLLFMLARDYMPADMEIVDAGAFVGGSARALAAGLDARLDKSGFIGRVHSYDLFRTKSDYYNKVLLGTVGEDGSFLPHFVQNTRQWAEYINVYAGDFTDFRWIGRPISLLFVDISKTPQLDRYVWTEFVPHLKVGRSMMIQQDFVHIHAPYVHVALGYYIDHFDILGLVGSSLLMRYRRKIDHTALEDGANLATQGAFEDKMQALDRLSERLSPLQAYEGSATLELVKCRVALDHDEIDLARRTVAAVRRDFADLTHPHFQARVRYIEDRLPKD